MKAQRTGKLSTTTGYFYRLGLALVATGVIIAFSGGLLGRTLFAGLMQLLPLLGAPEDRDFLPPSEPEAGVEIIQMVGLLTIACGGSIFSLRLLGEFLGLTGRLGWAAKLRGTTKLVLGTTALGFLIYVSGAVPELLLYEIFLFDYGDAGALSALSTVVSVGSVLFTFGLALLVLQRLGWFSVLLGPWTSRLGLGLIVIGAGGMLLELGNAFALVVLVGIATMTIGFVRQRAK